MVNETTNIPGTQGCVAKISTSAIFTRQKTLQLFPVDENWTEQSCAAPHGHGCHQVAATCWPSTNVPYRNLMARVGIIEKSYIYATTNLSNAHA